MTKLLQAISAAAILAFGATAALAQTTSPTPPTQSPTGSPNKKPQGGADSNAKTVPANPPASATAPTGSGSRPFGQKGDMENHAPAPSKDIKKKSTN